MYISVAGFLYLNKKGDSFHYCMYMTMDCLFWGMWALDHNYTVKISVWQLAPANIITQAILYQLTQFTGHQSQALPAKQNVMNVTGHNPKQRIPR